MAPDQRYCLSCGNRRGEPRLPFMDAVAFMDAMHAGPPPSAAAAPPPSPPRPRFTSGTTLVAGVATLVLAIGVGVLIGQGGNESSQPVASQAPIVVKTDGGGGGSSETEGSEATAGKSKDGGGKDKAKKGEIETGSSGTSEGAEEFIKPKSGVKLAAPETKVGEKCDKDVAGCSDSGEFDGSFFGE